MVDSGIGLSYRPASLSLTDWYDNSMTELTISPKSMTKNLVTVLNLQRQFADGFITPSQQYSNYNLSLKYHNCNSINAHIAQLQLSALPSYFHAKNTGFHRQRRHLQTDRPSLLTFLSNKLERILTQKVAYQIEGHFLLLPSSSSSLLKYETVGKRARRESNPLLAPEQCTKLQGRSFQAKSVLKTGGGGGGVKLA